MPVYSPLRPIRAGFFLYTLLLLAACSSDDEAAKPRAAPRPFRMVVADTATGTLQGAVHVVQEPFEDVGLKRTPIPEPLAKLVKNPYLEPRAPVCLNIKEELAQLHELLGADIDEAIAETAKSYREEGAHVAQDQALGLMRSRVDIIPFRGVVRRLSGAEKHARKVVRAYEAGKIRRGFLRGLALAHQCR